GRRIAAFLGAVLLGTNWLFWWHAVMAETYAMATALLIGILLLVLVWRATDKAWYLFVAGALGGLSIGVHNTVALAAPAILVYLLLTARRRSAWLAATAGAGLGLALMLAAFAWVGGVETPASYYNTTLRFSLRSMGIDPFRSVADRMWFMLSGRQYRGRMFSSPQATMPNLAGAYLKYLETSFSVLGIALAGAGWLSACARRWRGPDDSSDGAGRTHHRAEPDGSEGHQGRAGGLPVSDPRPAGTRAAGARDGRATGSRSDPVRRLGPAPHVLLRGPRRRDPARPGIHGVVGLRLSRGLSALVPLPGHPCGAAARVLEPAAGRVRRIAVHPEGSL